MKVVCISDTHYTDKNLKNLVIPDGDVLIHAGDATMRGEVGEITKFMNWFADQPHKVKLFTPGNHDFWFESYWGWEGPNVKMLINEWCQFEFEDQIYEVFGSPNSKEFNNWAFGVSERQMGSMLQNLDRAKLDILITHGPPYGVLDSFPTEHTNQDGTVLHAREHLGLRSLRAFVDQRKPKLHVFGHVHDSHGIEQIGPTTFVNAALLNEEYKMVNQPIVAEI